MAKLKIGDHVQVLQDIDAPYGQWGPLIERKNEVGIVEGFSEPVNSFSPTLVKVAFPKRKGFTHITNWTTKTGCLRKVSNEEVEIFRYDKLKAINGYLVLIETFSEYKDKAFVEAIHSLRQLTEKYCIKTLSPVTSFPSKDLDQAVLKANFTLRHDQSKDQLIKNMKERIMNYKFRDLNEPIPRTYTFESSHKASVDLYEILTTLSREHPVALVNTGVKPYYICVHRSLVLKSRMCGISFPEVSYVHEETLGKAYTLGSINDFGIWMPVLKNIHTAPWPKELRHTDMLPKKDKDGKWIRDENGDKILFETEVTRTIEVTLPVL